MVRDPGVTALKEALQSNCTLTHLSLPKNWIGGLGAEALAKGLQTNFTLTHLDLSKNLGGDSVAVALAQALESKCALKFLDLSQSVERTERKAPLAVLEDGVHVELMGPLGASALARALWSNSTLTY